MENPVILAFLLACPAVFGADGIRTVDVRPGGGLFGQVVDSAEWNTTFYFHNMDSIEINVGLLFFDDTGHPLKMPFGGDTTEAISFTMAPNATRVFETNGTGQLKQGQAVVITCDKLCSNPSGVQVMAKLGALAVFRHRVPGVQDSEAVVPMEQPSKSARIVFDNRLGYATGIAFLNAFFSSPDTISVIIRDGSGAVLFQDSLLLGVLEKKVFSLATQYPVTAGKHGSIELTGKAVVALGLRFSPNGSFTSSHAMVPLPGIP